MKIDVKLVTGLNFFNFTIRVHHLTLWAGRDITSVLKS